MAIPCRMIDQACLIDLDIQNIENTGNFDKIKIISYHVAMKRPKIFNKVSINAKIMLTRL